MIDYIILATSNRENKDPWNYWSFEAEIWNQTISKEVESAPRLPSRYY
jgi:hypothetical protein